MTAASSPLLVIDGNPAEARAELTRAIGRDLVAQLAELVGRLRPGLACEGYYAVDAAARGTLPRDLARYRGAVIAGSVLHAYDDDPAIAHQKRVVNALLDEGVAVLGFCWGLQIGAAALGGRVALDPRGPEIGLARAIELTEAGRRDDVLRDRRSGFDSHAWHLDAVVEPPPGATLLATNAGGRVQALRVDRPRASFIGVQYHPEFDVAVMRDLERALRRPDEPPIATLPDDVPIGVELDSWLETLESH